jgi:phospholipid transport system substrate-binding protein
MTLSPTHTSRLRATSPMPERHRFSFAGAAAIAALIVLLALLAPMALAEELAPDALIKSLTADVTAAVRQDPAIRAGNSRRLSELVEAKIVPHFDFNRAVQIAMGPNWRRATPEQQEELTREFKTLVLRTYSGALAAYRDQAITFRPLRAHPGDSEVTVRSEINQPASEPLAIEYDMEKTGADWKVYDIRVSGISLVATYRNTFSQEVRNHGIEGLIQGLATKNRQAITAGTRS